MLTFFAPTHRTACLNFAEVSDDDAATYDRLIAAYWQAVKTVAAQDGIALTVAPTPSPGDRAYHAETHEEQQWLRNTSILDFWDWAAWY